MKDVIIRISNTYRSGKYDESMIAMCYDGGIHFTTVRYIFNEAKADLLLNKIGKLGGEVKYRINQFDSKITYLEAEVYRTSR